MPVDFSQSKEQAAILKIADNLPVGRFLDIGAGDGETFSNTRELALRGWKGVCVEPAPWAFDRLSALYADSQVECVNAVVTAKTSGLVRFYYSRDDHLSTLSKAHAERWEKLVDFQEITMLAVTLRDLLDYFQADFSVVSIDTEGETMDLLDAYRKHLAWEKVRCLCVEAEDERDRFEIEQGARAAFTSANNVVLAL